MKIILVIPLLFTLAGCAGVPRVGNAGGAESDLAHLRRQLVDIHGSRDAAAFGALHTEAVVYEWRGRSGSVVGRAALESSMREIWATRRELRLNLEVSELRVHADRAYEYGAYEETWTNARGSQVTEFGRYVTAYLLERSGQWRIERTFGFSNLIATRADGG
jgi:nuclear transport factor 2 (NTF2) superfamily protein